MPALTVENIPAALYEQLKASAQANHRSIDGEIIHRLETTLMPRRTPPQTFLDAARTLRQRVRTQGIPLEEIDAAKREGRE